MADHTLSPRNCHGSLRNSFQSQSTFPLSSLPEEVLLRVFEIAVDSDLDSHGFVIPARSTAPVVLSWVCSSWRRLVLTTNKFWASVSVSLGSLPWLVSPSFSTSEWDGDGDCVALEVFIRRSGETLPLSFALDCGAWADPARPWTVSSDSDSPEGRKLVVHVEGLARRIVPLRHRWRRLIVNVPDLKALRPFLDPGPPHQGDISMPNLEELNLSTTLADFNGTQFALPPLKTCSRSLKTVRIMSPMIYFDPTQPRLERLTNLELHFCHSQLDALAWLSCTPNLEMLLIEFYTSASVSVSQAESTVDSSASESESRRNDSDGSAGISGRKICLARLRRFSLVCFYGTSNTCELLFNSLSLPSLQSFSFTRSDIRGTVPQPDDNTWQNMVNLLLPGSQTLGELRLIDALSSPSELRNLLCHVGGNLRYLALGGQAITDELLDGFYLWKTSSITGQLRLSEPLCPNLESLELLDVDISSSTIIALASCRATLEVSPPTPGSPHPGRAESTMPIPESTPPPPPPPPRPSRDLPSSSREHPQEQVQVQNQDHSKNEIISTTSLPAAGFAQQATSPPIAINNEYSEFRTLKHLFLLDEKFSRLFSSQNPQGSSSSSLPDTLNVVFL